MVIPGFEVVVAPSGRVASGAIPGAANKLYYQIGGVKRFYLQNFYHRRVLGLPTAR
jgi:hypothetical protein